MPDTSWLSDLNLIDLVGEWSQDPFLHPFTGILQSVRVFQPVVGNDLQYLCKIYPKQEQAIVWTPHPYLFQLSKINALDILKNRGLTSNDWVSIASCYGAINVWKSFWGVWPDYYSIIIEHAGTAPSKPPSIIDILSSSSLESEPHEGGGRSFFFPEGKCLVHMNCSEFFRNGYPVVFSWSDRRNYKANNLQLRKLFRGYHIRVADAYGNIVQFDDYL